MRPCVVLSCVYFKNRAPPQSERYIPFHKAIMPAGKMRLRNDMWHDLRGINYMLFEFEKIK